MPPQIDENTTTDDDILCEKMVDIDKLCSSINYKFIDRDIGQTDHINCLTTNSHITIPNIKATKTVGAK